MKTTEEIKQDLRALHTKYGFENYLDRLNSKNKERLTDLLMAVLDYGKINKPQWIYDMWNCMTKSQILDIYKRLLLSPSVDYDELIRRICSKHLTTALINREVISAEDAILSREWQNENNPGLLDNCFND